MPVHHSEMSERQVTGRFQLQVSRFQSFEMQDAEVKAPKYGWLLSPLNFETLKL